MRRLLPIFLLFFSCVAAKAQFSLSGEDPGNIRWMRVDTPGFRIIYPEGADTLAVVYGSWLEKNRTAVSWSSGMKIGEYYKRRMPVVLHSFTPVANASVTWAPKRMDIFTTLDPYSPTPIPWEKLLAIHEGRHAAQMQAGAGGKMRIFHYLTGELFAGAVAGIYAGPTLLEGDAVVAETAMTRSGRGRQASFLEYMAPALDCGDWRDYWRWSLGSGKYYTPDHYKAGYLLVSGMRVFYDDPFFTEDYFSKVKKDGLFVLRKTVKEASGTGIKKTFRSILSENHDIWSADALAREPFMPSSQVSDKPWRHVSYSGSVIDKNGMIWSKKSGLTVSGSLVRSSASGHETRLRSFASYSSPLAYDKAGGKIWWSENVADTRWSLGGSSRIRFVSTDKPSQVKDLTKEGRYFNPAPSPDGKFVAAIEYPTFGGSRIAVMNTGDGSVERVLEAPDSLQFTEVAWLGDKLFAAGLSDNGMGIYSLEPLKPLLDPMPVELSTLRPNLGALTFVCDRTGVKEMYLLNPGSGTLSQVTSTRYGISSPVLNNTADTLYYSSLAPSDRPEAYRQGWVIYSTPVKDLPMTPVSFSDIHEYPVAEALSKQEKELADGAWETTLEFSPAAFSDPRRHWKLTPTLHSWIPVYFNYDNVDSVSEDEYFKTASLGATAFFQNLVGDGYGFVGYGFHQDPDIEGTWRHSGHLKYVYNGLYPMIELSADIGDRAAKDLMRVQQTNVQEHSASVFTDRERIATRPYVEGSARLYIPFNLSSGGISRGIIPQVRYRFTNDRVNDRISIRNKVEKDGETTVKEVASIYQDHLSYLSSFDFSVRGYVMRSKAPSQTYPRLGIGAEIGFRTRPGLSLSYGNTTYIYSYGYLPGFLQDQGLKVSAILGAKVGGGELSMPDSPASFTPRGFVDSNVGSLLNACSTLKGKVSLDYAIRFLNIDWSGLSPVAYIKNLTLIPFADCSFLKFNVSDKYLINPAGVRSDRLTSVGLDLAVTLGNFLWLPYDTQVGVRYSRNNWNNLDQFRIKGLSKNYFGAIFNVPL